MGKAEHVYIFFRKHYGHVRPLRFLNGSIHHDGMNLSKVVSSLFLFSNSRDDPPDISIILPKVGSAAGWAFWLVWFSCLSGGPRRGGAALLGLLELWAGEAALVGFAAGVAS